MPIPAEPGRGDLPVVRLFGGPTLRAAGAGGGGSVHVTVGPQAVARVLAALAMDAGNVVPIDTLIDRVWGADAPASARRSLQAHLTRLRQTLTDTLPGAPDRPAVVVTRRSSGYCLDVDPLQVDVHLFRNLRDRAGARDCTSDAASALLERALGLCSAPALAGLSGGEWVDRVRAGLEAEAVDAALAWGRAALSVGHHEQVVRRIRDLVTSHPLVEPLVEVLTRALHAAGRDAEAIECYLAARERLVAELGTEPGQALRQVYEALLRGDLDDGDPVSALLEPGQATDVTLSGPGRAVAEADIPAGVPTHAPALAPAPAPAPADVPADVPAPDVTAPDVTAPVAEPGQLPSGLEQLPAPVSAFTGRAEELAVLDQWLADALSAGTAPMPATSPIVISAVSGTAGVGKTALAVHWAHGVRDRFPDGQVFLNLRGYDPAGALPVADALAHLLTTLGMPGTKVPLDVDGRAAALRGLLAGRRMLLVLDNAADAEQVRPLLPGAGSCVVLVTSRDSLAGLVVREGARRLTLDLLPDDAAAHLIEALVGDRARQDPGSVAALAQCCARLPLALRIAAELAAVRADVPLTGLVDELTEAPQTSAAASPALAPRGRPRLDLLEADGDPRSAVRAVFSWSYRNLSDEAARAFRLAGLHHGPNLDAYDLAALADLPLERAARLLDGLARANLVQPLGHGRYGLHDLLATYALELAAGTGRDDTVQAALTRLLDHELAAASAAMDTLVPAERHRRPTVAAPSTPAPDLTDRLSAQAWLDARRPGLTAAVAHAGLHDLHRHAIGLASVLFRYLDIGGHLSESLSVNTHALESARILADQAAEAGCLSNLGASHWRQGRVELAVRHFDDAARLAHRAGDRMQEARAHGNLGFVAVDQGDGAAAMVHLQGALDLYVELGDVQGQASSLSLLAGVQFRSGRFLDSIANLTATLPLARAIGDRFTECDSLTNLAEVEERAGHDDDALRHCDQAIAIADETGAAWVQIHARGLRAAVLGRSGRPGDAERCAALFEDALTRVVGLGDPMGAATLRTLRGETLDRQGHPARALPDLEAATQDLRATGNRSGLARALNSLGAALRRLGRHEQASACHEEALTLATQLGDGFERDRASVGLGAVVPVARWGSVG